MIYVLGAKSKRNLEGVHPDVVRVVERAIALTEQDFGVHEGLRSLETQRKYLARKVTKTLKSKHLRQADGYGHAVDLVPYVDGVLRWEWPLIWDIAAAMQTAAIEEGVSLRWGGVWDRRLNLLQQGPEGLRKEVEAYTLRHPGPDFLDGPHYELVP